MHSFSLKLRLHITCCLEERPTPTCSSFQRLEASWSLSSSLAVVSGGRRRSCRSCWRVQSSDDETNLLLHFHHHRHSSSKNLRSLQPLSFVLLFYSVQTLLPTTFLPHTFSLVGLHRRRQPRSFAAFQRRSTACCSTARGREEETKRNKENKKLKTC